MPFPLPSSRSWRDGDLEPPTAARRTAGGVPLRLRLRLGLPRRKSGVGDRSSLLARLLGGGVEPSRMSSLPPRRAGPEDLDLDLRSLKLDDRLLRLAVGGLLDLDFIVLVSPGLPSRGDLERGRRAAAPLMLRPPLPLLEGGGGVDPMRLAAAGGVRDRLRGGERLRCCGGGDRESRLRRGGGGGEREPGLRREGGGGGGDLESRRRGGGGILRRGGPEDLEPEREREGVREGERPRLLGGGGPRRAGGVALLPTSRLGGLRLRLRLGLLRLGLSLGDFDLGDLDLEDLALLERRRGGLPGGPKGRLGGGGRGDLEREYEGDRRLRPGGERDRYRGGGGERE